MRIPSVVLVLVAFLAAIPSVGSSVEPDKIDRAIAFLKAACVTRGERTEISAKGNAGITIKNWKNAGVEGEVSFSKQEIEGLASALQAETANQATEMRKCMQPYIQKILDSILGVDDSGSKQSTPQRVYLIVQERDGDPTWEEGDAFLTYDLTLDERKILKVDSRTVRRKVSLGELTVGQHTLTLDNIIHHNAFRMGGAGGQYDHRFGQCGPRRFAVRPDEGDYVLAFATDLQRERVACNVVPFGTDSGPPVWQR